MRAMILAAGRGERLRPLTDKIPKPLLQVGSRRLIEHHIERLSNQGFKEIIINTHHLAELVETTLGDGSAYGVTLKYSRETHALLETGGGIANALPLLGEQPFLVVNGDILCDYSLTPRALSPDQNMHLIMVDNPQHHSEGDFYYQEGMLHPQLGSRLTFSGIGYYRPELFRNRPSVFKLAQIMNEQIAQHKVSAEHYQGNWMDVGTPMRLLQATKMMMNT